MTTAPPASTDVVITPESGTWDRYREVNIGRLTLAAGEQRVVFRAEGPIKEYLIDLRALRLQPVR